MKTESLVVLDAQAVMEVFAKPQLVMNGPVVDKVLRTLKRGEIIRRDIAERQTAVKQAVAYTTLRSHDALLCLQRNQYSGADLRGTWTIVFGGHVNADERNGMPGLRRCLHRELHEEFGGVELHEPTFVGLVADPTSDRGKRHLGFVFEARVHADTLELDRRYDNRQYSRIRGKRYFLKISQLLNVERDRFDPWSRLVLDAYRDRR
ncbi:MAG TPA: NUDIX domain-containing protein [Solirubrobacterales bacterium]|nr:NUDIX domain-containing protein [Solirubrobacterales bacterium]